MAHVIRRAVIQRIAQERHVSIAVAATIYGWWPIDRKRRACEQEVARREAKKNGDRP